MYSASEDFSNILIIGNLVAGLNNGRQVDTEFIAQIDLEGVGEGKPRAKLYKVWGVSGIAIPCFLSDTGLISNRIVHHGSRLCLNRGFTDQGFYSSNNQTQVEMHNYKFHNFVNLNLNLIIMRLL